MESERAAIYRTAPSSAKENENPQTKLYNSPEHCGSGKSTMTPVESDDRSDPKLNKLPSLSNRQTPKGVSKLGQKSDAKREKNSARYHNQDLNYIFKSLNCQKVRGTKK
ncbi:unnamed protein product [Nesidiocoris tenuis]|uniref:Uncharacterized protein n=1 Tax=Nesidiocoris tenuis TaxID=355587 RepID=A0A6H5H7N6_9HEMI|nr:unnamed protein product [Nesidiocoris tenuis]